MKFDKTYPTFGIITRSKLLLFCVSMNEVVYLLFIAFGKRKVQMNSKDESDDQIINCVSYYILFIKDYSFSILPFIILMCTRSNTSDVLPSIRNKIYFLLLLTILKL